MQLTRIRKEFESKLYYARCAAESCADENSNLQNEKNAILAKLKDEEAAQRRAEQDAEKLRLTLRFERDLHRQELKEICKQSNISNQRHQIQISQKYKAQMNNSLNTLRGQLEDQLRLNHINFDNQMKTLQGPMSADAGGAAIGSITDSQGQLIASQAQIGSLRSQLAECQAHVTSLELQIRYWKEILEDDQTQMNNLQKIIQDLCQKYQKLLDDKVKIQSELDNYNGILQAEESRLQLADMCDAGTQEIREAEGDKGSADTKTYEFEIDYYPNQM